MEVRRMPNSMSELYHHGIKGQEWGDRNGPPYPLDSNASVQAKKKKKSLIRRIKDKKKGKMLRKAKEAKKAEREAKERIITSGDAATVKKYMNYLTDDELSRAVERVKASKTLNEAYEKDISIYNAANGSNKKTTKTGMDYVANIDKTFKMVGTVATGLTAAYGLYEKINKN